MKFNGQSGAGQGSNVVKLKLVYLFNLVLIFAIACTLTVLVNELDKILVFDMKGQSDPDVLRELALIMIGAHAAFILVLCGMCYWFLCQQERLHRVAHPVGYALTIVFPLALLIYGIIVLCQRVPEFQEGQKTRIERKWGVVLVPAVVLIAATWGNLMPVIELL